MKEFKKLKFQIVIPQDILQAVELLEKLGYEVVRNDFSADDAAKHNGVCTWDDGEITEGWLDTYSGFKQVTLEGLKEMVGEGTKDDTFTLERLLGCEVLFENRYQSSKGYITSFDNGCSVTLDCGVIITLPNMSRLTFFTEGGDELTFDEYVQLYYPKG